MGICINLGVFQVEYLLEMKYSKVSTHQGIFIGKGTSDKHIAEGGRNKKDTVEISGHCQSQV